MKKHLWHVTYTKLSWIAKPSDGHNGFKGQVDLILDTLFKSHIQHLIKKPTLICYVVE